MKLRFGLHISVICTVHSFKLVIFHHSFLVKFPVLLLLSEAPEPLVHVPRPGYHREFGRHLLLKAIGAPSDRRHVGETLGPLFHLLDVVLLHESDGGEAAPARRRPRPLAHGAVRVVAGEPLPALLALVTAAGTGAKDGRCGVETILAAIRRRQGCQVLQVCVGDPKETEEGKEEGELTDLAYFCLCLHFLCFIRDGVKFCLGQSLNFFGNLPSPVQGSCGTLPF